MTIVGTGIDIIEIQRLQKALDRWGEDFLKHIFNEEEIAYAKDKKFPAQHYAARFAAKEAVYKAFGDNRTLSWKDMTIVNDENGKPHCRLKNKNIKGEVEVLIAGDEEKEIRLGVRREGEFFGEMAIFDRDVRSATVKALGEARVLTVDKKNFMRRVHEDPSLAFRLVETMSHRIRELGEEVARLQKTS